MLLESIKDITKDGRIVIDGKQFPSTIIANHMRELKKNIEINRASGFINLAGRAQKELEELLQIYYDVSSKDSQYTKSEYQERLTSLQRQLQQAKSIGDTEEAKELQKEIDDLKTLESGVQDASISEDPKYKELKEALYKAGRNNNQDEIKRIQKQIDNYIRRNDVIKDTEAKITDLTEKAKAARAQGYAADQYEAEIEKLKAQDKKTKDEEFRPGDKVKTKGSFASTTGITGRVIKKVIINFASGPQDRYIIKMDEGGEREIRADELVKDSTKDSPRDNIERQIDELEDELEDATGKKKSDIQAKIKELEKQLETVNDAYDEVDWLTLDPLTEKGKEILASMKKEYGDERGEKIFYASKNAGKIIGVDSKDADNYKGYNIGSAFKMKGTSNVRYEVSANKNGNNLMGRGDTPEEALEEVKKKIDKEG